MKQSLFASWFETIASTATGFLISLALQHVVCWWYDLPLRMEDNLAIIAVFTAASLLRGIAWRRLMEKLHIRTPLSPSLLAIAAERRRQREVEGYDDTHDDQHVVGELAAAGASYALASGEHRSTPPIDWPWDDIYWKPQDMRRDLVRAGALIVAELDGLERRRRRRKNNKTTIQSNGTASA